MEYYSAPNKNKLSSHENTWRKLIGMVPVQEDQSEKATYYMVPTILTFWKRQNYGASKKINGCHWLGARGGTNSQSTEDILGSESILYDTTIEDTCHYTFFKAQ